MTARIVRTSILHACVIVAFLLFIPHALAQDALSNGAMTLSLDAPGMLEAAAQAVAGAEGADLSDVKTLTISGEIDNSDLNSINRNMRGIEALFLRDATLKADVLQARMSILTKLHTITLPKADSGGYAIGDATFANCILLEGTLTLPEGVSAVGDGAFENCAALERLVLPKTLASLGARAFAECKQLSALKIPANVLNIGEEVFSGCDALKAENVTLLAAPDKVNYAKSAFDFDTAACFVAQQDTDEGNSGNGGNGNNGGSVASTGSVSTTAAASSASLMPYPGATQAAQKTAEDKDAKTQVLEPVMEMAMASEAAEETAAAAKTAKAARTVDKPADAGQTKKAESKQPAAQTATRNAADEAATRNAAAGTAGAAEAVRPNVAAAQAPQTAAIPQANSQPLTQEPLAQGAAGNAAYVAQAELELAELPGVDEEVPMGALAFMPTRIADVSDASWVWWCVGGAAVLAGAGMLLWRNQGKLRRSKARRVWVTRSLDGV